jgi:hypothetical protein
MTAAAEGEESRKRFKVGPEPGGECSFEQWRVWYCTTDAKTEWKRAAVVVEFPDEEFAARTVAKYENFGGKGHRLCTLLNDLLGDDVSIYNAEIRRQHGTDVACWTGLPRDVVLPYWSFEAKEPEDDD